VSDDTKTISRYMVNPLATVTRHVYNRCMKKEHAVIYGVYDNAGECVYVGRTQCKLSQRFSNHKAKSLRSPKSRFHKWLKLEIESKRNVSIKTLERCFVAMMSDREEHWINKLKPSKNSAKPHDGGKKHSDIDWDPFLPILGIEHDSTIAKLAGVTRKAVAYQRNALGIPATTKPQRVVIVNKLGGWNRIELPADCIAMLGTMPDYKVAEVFSVSKPRISRERRARGIKSYAEQTGNDGRIRKNEPHRRWS